MNDSAPFSHPNRVGTPAELCWACDGAGTVADRQWPSGRDICPTCFGRRVIAQAPARQQEAA